MSLDQSLATALAGLRVTQAGLAVVAGNVANAQTPGYITRTVDQLPIPEPDAGDSVKVGAINRVLDQLIQQQLRTESSGGSFADLRASIYDQLQRVYGQPGSNTSFDAIYNAFTTAAQTLATSPQSPSAQSGILAAAQAMVQQLSTMTNGIQQLRTQADLGIANDIQLANQQLQTIANANSKLASATPGDNQTVDLEDQRDHAIDQLAKLMDIRVIRGDHDQVTVFTGSGFQLVGAQASQLAFTTTGTITPSQQYNPNPAKSGLSTVSLIAPGGATTDLLANGGIRAGEIGAYIDMRDNVLVKAQGQLDEFAAQMSKALSDLTTNGTAVTVGANTGFTVDISNVLPGNTLQIAYTDSSNVQHKITVVRVEDPTALPLAGTATPDPNDQVVGISFAGGAAAVAARLQAALGMTGLQFSNPAGNLLQVLNGGPAQSVDQLSSTATMTSLVSGNAPLPFFIDGTVPYTGEITGNGAQSLGFAGRITVNPALLADPSKLVVYSAAPPTPAGDQTRPNFIDQQLTSTPLLFSPATGIGGTAAPFNGTLSGFVSQIIGQQGLDAVAANNLKEGQDIVVNALQQRFNDKSGVNIDVEMSRLLTLQNTYGANARVMTTVQQMFTALLQM